LRRLGVLVDFGYGELAQGTVRRLLFLEGGVEQQEALERTAERVRVPDFRFYIVALVFLIFDVEVALFYPWAVAYGSAAELATQFGQTIFDIRKVAVVDMLFFFGVLLVGFAYLWRFGYLDWVRSAATTSLKVDYRPGIDLRREARADRPF